MPPPRKTDPAEVIPARDLDNMPGDEVPTRWAPSMEIGRSGLRRFSGYVEEEFLPQLKGPKGVEVLKEMSENNPIAGSFLFSIVNLLRQLKWDAEAASDDSADQENQKFLEGAMTDMSHSWGDMITEILTCAIFGWAWMEITYKRRVGPWETDSARKSQFDDGQWGWRKIALRGQETLQRWGFDENGGIKWMVQMAPPRYELKPLPIEKCLLFRVSTVKNNPEGRSMLRSMYWPWYMMKRLCEHEAVGVERDLTGLPKAGLPARYFEAKPGSKEAKMLAATKKIVRNVRRDENEGLVWPSHFDPDTKQEEFTFELMTSGGSRQFNTDQMIQRYAAWQLVAVLADFILLGQKDVGSYAMHTDKSGLFRTSLNALAEMIADIFNRHAVPRLFALNGNKPDKLPKIKPTSVEDVNLTELASFITAMTQAGASFFPDPKMEQFVRSVARLPELDEDQVAQRETMERQQEVLNQANQQLQMMQADQQAQMGQMGLEQQRMGLGQQKQELEMGPQQGQGPPDAAEQKQLGAVKVGHEQKMSGFKQDREKQALATDKVRHDQEKAKLTNLRKPPAPPGRGPVNGKRPPRKPVGKSFSGGVLVRTYNGGGR